MIQSDRLLNTFLALVGIDSPSGEEGRIAEYLVRQFKQMGLDAEVDCIGNVIARMDGLGEPLLLNAHMDNVTPCKGVKPVVAEGVVRSDGTTVLGGDDKAGVAVILETLRVVIEQGLPHPPLEVVITVQEEVGLRGAKALDMGKLRAKLGIGLDGGNERGAIIIAAPSQNYLSAVIHGRASHAGACPEDGISAIVTASEAITQMQLGRIDSETTANIGTIHGGRATNIIPDRVELRGEARSRNEDKLSSQTNAMADALRSAASKYGGSVDVEVERAYTGYALTESDRIVRLVSLAMRSLGLEPKLVTAGAGFDANVFNAGGIQVVNVSVGEDRVHTAEERVALSDMVCGAELVLACLAVTCK